ncbi:prefoldin subunit alpha [Candidatus Woesearchaeota archaeon]|jgi:prefoldin alpha subunit|nr:prefoldin subunit alpha [Candidatus Woesearchaeota archaeon]MBT4387982.1 prefoldin subunit alpha [Candidatus Woesearchaeota archaeon]MBT4595326.1 prefoldin subunit alpha [Candidatus Woesearchaeota archaeon]MBT5741269.1 prefoldin subunit alpha [Candidatus Woesearchaeota archaeon]MBT7849592.1 prefoldin subunit alpha [Candidatus Woesearchaeota archaeon]
MESKNIDLKHKYMQLEEIENQIKSFNEKINSIQDDLLRLNDVKENLISLKEQKNDQNSLISVLEGIYIKANIIDFSNLYINIGSDIIAKKSYTEVFELIELQRKTLNQTTESLKNSILELDSQALKLEKELESEVKE